MNRREAAGDLSVADIRADFGRRHMAWRTEFCAVLHYSDTSGFYQALAEFKQAQAAIESIRTIIAKKTIRAPSGNTNCGAVSLPTP